MHPYGLMAELVARGHHVELDERTQARMRRQPPRAARTTRRFRRR